MIQSINWSSYLLNRQLLRNFQTIYMDTHNNPLTYILQKIKLDVNSHRWIAALSSYDFSISYRFGKSNIDVDSLFPHAT